MIRNRFILEQYDGDLNNPRASVIEPLNRGIETVKFEINGLNTRINLDKFNYYPKESEQYKNGLLAYYDIHYNSNSLFFFRLQMLKDEISEIAIDPYIPQRKYKAKNKEYTQYLNKKSATKSFILNLAKPDDLELVREWFKDRTNKDI